MRIMDLIKTMSCCSRNPQVRTNTAQTTAKSRCHMYKVGKSTMAAIKDKGVKVESFCYPDNENQYYVALTDAQAKKCSLRTDSKLAQAPVEFQNETEFLNRFTISGKREDRRVVDLKVTDLYKPPTTGQDIINFLKSNMRPNQHKGLDDSFKEGRIFLSNGNLMKLLYSGILDGKPSVSPVVASNVQNTAGSVADAAARMLLNIPTTDIEPAVADAAPSAILGIPPKDSPKDAYTDYLQQAWISDVEGEFGAYGKAIKALIDSGVKAETLIDALENVRHESMVNPHNRGTVKPFQSDNKTSFPDTYMLSNFSEPKITINGKEYKTVEHFMHSMKYLVAASVAEDPTVIQACKNHAEKIRQADTPMQARNWGSSSGGGPNIRFAMPEYDKVKFQYTFIALKQKFSQEPAKTQLITLLTKSLIIEDTRNLCHYPDSEWGTGSRGDNNYKAMLGKLIMLTQMGADLDTRDIEKGLNALISTQRTVTAPLDSESKPGGWEGNSDYARPLPDGTERKNVRLNVKSTDIIILGNRTRTPFKGRDGNFYLACTKAEYEHLLKNGQLA